MVKGIFMFRGDIDRAVKKAIETRDKCELLRLARDPDIDVRVRLAEHLCKANDRNVIAKALKILTEDSEKEVRLVIVKGLLDLSEACPDALDIVLPFFIRNPDENVRSVVSLNLMRLSQASPAAMEVVLPTLVRDGCGPIRSDLARCFSELSEIFPDTMAKLWPVLAKDTNENVRQCAAAGTTLELARSYPKAYHKLKKDASLHVRHTLRARNIDPKDVPAPSSPAKAAALNAGTMPAAKLKN